MSFFPNNFIDELRARVSVVETVGRSVKLSRKGRDWWGCCPFHNEKTPSFTVSDEKGFYHCFGCSEHGDAITFEMKVNNLTFVEAVEKLAGIAGMEVPKQTPVDIKKEQKRVSLFEVVEKACKFFQDMLYLSAGEKALEYIKSRGISEKSIKEFRLGYAPAGNALREYLISQGVTMEQMIKAGLCSKKDNNTYDYFRDRLMFPITDRKGKVIAFGGRIMGQGEPKYLNSPETDLFHKSQVLYAFDKAKTNARKHNSLIVVEGYMDVIALYQAGINYAVAPLGTALTETQILSLWQMTNEPVLCFDGDSAGKNAALRAVPRALPILKEGYSLKFSWMPSGLDPDDLIRTSGAVAFLDLVKHAEPLSDIVWQVIKSENDFSTPEKKAKTEKKITETTALIQNETIRRYYQQHLKDKMYDETVGKRFNKFKGKVKQKIVSRTIIIDDEKLKNLIAYILKYPEVSNNFIEQIASIESTNKYLNQKLRSLLDKLSDSFAAVEAEDKKDFALQIEMLGQKYKKLECPEPVIAKDIDRELKSLSLIGLYHDIKRIESEMIQEYDPEKLELLKSLIEERTKLEQELDS